ncbi:hypothetical protein BH11MYX3_BH11MYX3_19980 [soil metagenome]
MTTTAKSLRRTVLGVALLALGGTATAQPNDTTSNTPPPTTTSPTTSDGSTPTTTTTDTTTTNPNAAPTPPPIDDDAIAHPAGPPTVYVQPTTVVTPGPTSYDQSTDNRNLYERYGVAVSLGGGVEGFTQTSQRNATNDGGVWNLRLAVGTRSPVAIEGAYIGSAQSINGLGLDSNALLVGNGAQADARINLVDSLVQPFVYGGVAWKRYSLTNTSTRTSDLSDNDDVLEVPLGIGIASKYAGLLLDLRGEYRFSTRNDMFDATAPGDRMDRFGVNANIGYAF